MITYLLEFFLCAMVLRLRHHRITLATVRLLDIAPGTLGLERLEHGVCVSVCDVCGDLEIPNLNRPHSTDSYKIQIRVCL